MKLRPAGPHLHLIKSHYRKIIGGLDFVKNSIQMAVNSNMPKFLLNPSLFVNDEC